jgi:hypothetical protein
LTCDGIAFTLPLLSGHDKCVLFRIWAISGHQSTSFINTFCAVRKSVLTRRNDMWIAVSCHCI